MRILCLAAVACLCVGTAAVAASDDPKGDKEDKVVCKRQQDADTGSHFATTKKVCMLKSEWRQLEEGAENTLRRVREQGGACPTCLSPGRAVPGGG